MRNTVTPPKVEENRTKERDTVAVVNGLRTAANLRYEAELTTTTTLTAAATTVWLSDDMPTNSAWEVSVFVRGLASDASMGGYQRVGRFKRSTGNSALVGAVATPIADSEDVAGWDVTLSALAKGVRLTVTGDVTRTVNWAAFVQISEVRL